MEDHADLREIKAELLRHFGHTVEVAENGQVALEALVSRDPPAAMLIDSMMPVMDGVTLVERMVDAGLTERITAFLSSHVRGVWAFGPEYDEPKPPSTPAPMAVGVECENVARPIDAVIPMARR